MIKVVHASTEAANDQRCSQPRIRGFTSGGAVWGVAVTSRGYDTAGGYRVVRG
ncbi:hypothetical protein PA7_33840 [Pseudonocardia asaccharolytica DSM 44247 = NBRC 16224]|uniref:Uncharacterized protein n=1 Tax=Pseudonocardia asaccharolytica DSM 44247 = NBRC 16224 TaxID=1123024 RepID=A0A511D4G2_9PSEU|nr:hypothetical protein PA7_33840 [Pseudonocardia asaccharolytica DSM 44247 = NBRC 16224]